MRGIPTKKRKIKQKRKNKKMNKKTEKMITMRMKKKLIVQPVVFLIAVDIAYREDK